MAYCLFHPDRQGLGVCVRCRIVICAECCTRMDGINHCHGCLKSLAERPARTQRSPHTGWSLLALLLLGAALFGILWMAQGSLAPG